MSDKLYVVKDKDGFYWTGYNQFDRQLRKAKIYISPAQAEKTAKRCYLDGATVVEVELAEVTPKPKIDLQDDFFGCILNCAVRYAIGRQSYMPGLVIDFITPLIPHLNNKTLWCFDQDVTDAKWEGGYGDPRIDEPGWMKFREAVRAERIKRGETPYVSHWEGFK